MSSKREKAPLRRLIPNFIRLALSVAAALFGGTAAPAQDTSGRNMPVVNPTPDLNGVDVATGAFYVMSPLGFNAPGAGNLNVRSVFNGRKFSTTINTYLDDQTITRPDIGSPSDRQIRVHSGGIDRLFMCHGLGVCEQVAKIDGSRLARTAERTYNFQDGAGTAVTFFPLGVQPLDLCTDVETGCNAAGYNAYGYASLIKFANGETLTFSPFPTSQNGSFTDSVTSNLGYTLEIAYPCPNCTINPAYPGTTWLIHRTGMTYSATYRLRKAGADLAAISVNRNFVSGPVSADETVTITDQASRTFTINLHANRILPCGVVGGGGDIGNGNPVGGYDLTNFVPVSTLSPGNRATTITYQNVTHFAQGSTYIPVASVTRGGRTWTYNFGITSWLGNAASLAVTDPGQASSSARSVGWEVPWPTVWGNMDWCSVATLGSDVVEATNALGRKTKYDYAWQGTLSGTVNPEGDSQTYARDPRGNVTLITSMPKPGSSLPAITFEASFDAVCTNPVKCNQPNWTKDAKGGRTDYSYDPVHGGVTRIILPPSPSGVRPEKRFTYEAISTSAGPLYRLQRVSECIASSSCAGTADEIATTYTYWNTTFLKAGETRQAGNGGTALTTAYAYDDAGRLVQETLPGGATNAFFYDSAGRRSGSIGPDPDGDGVLPRLAQRIAYNPDDQITRIEEGTATAATGSALAAMQVRKVIDFTYDSAGLKIREAVTGSTGAIEQVTQYSYDAVGRLECTAVRMNPGNYTSLPASACSLSQPAHPTFGPDRITRNIHDAAGQLKTVQRAYGVTIANGFPATLQQNYAGYEYTDNGRRKAVIDANGNRAELRYDGHDRQSCWIFPSKTIPGALGGNCVSGDFEGYGYDPAGNRTSLRKRDGVTLGFQYDALDRMTLKTVPASATGAAGYGVHYGYDLRGLQTYARFGSAAGAGITNSYDVFGRLVSSATNMDGVSRAMTSQYDADGNRLLLTGDQGYYAPFGYDGLGRMTAYATLARFGYDSAGRRSSLVMGPGWTSSTIGYAYDPVGRLQTLTHRFVATSADQALDFTYNPASQIVTRSGSNNAYASNTAYNVNRLYGVNGLNQYTAAGPAAFAYDANGNLTSDGSTGFVYDSENRLVAASGAKNAALAYDPLGRLWQVSSGASTTRFLYDGDRLVMEYNGAGNVTRAYVHGPGVDEPLVLYEAGQRRFLHADHQGSIIALNDDNGTPIAINGYDSWGIPNAANAGRFGYTGQAWIPELGLWYYKARFYSPTTGRFMQVDPVGYDDQINLYAYVGNDPVNQADPSGRQVAQIPQVVARACGATPVCTGAVSKGAEATLKLGVALGLATAEKKDDRPRVNVDTNVLINILDKPTPLAAANAASAVGNRVAVVSPYAAQEYLKGNPRAGLTPEIAHGRLTAFLASKAAEGGNLGDPLTAGRLMLVNGLKVNDAQIVAAGVGEGIPTLTSDLRMANKVPDLTEIYRPN